MKHYLITFLIFLLISSGSMAQEVAVEAAPEKLSNAVNTGSEETLPLLSASGDRLYFVRSFYDSNIGGRYAGQDIWYSDRYRSGRWQEAVNLSELNTDLNNAIIGTNESENTLFLLNSYASSARKAYGIAQTHLKNGKWTVPLDFPLAMEIEGELRSFYISPQQDVVIYSTRSFNSYGKEDLYLYYRKNTAWVGPIHLDDAINSAGAEISPFLTEDRKALFFASDGRDGHGDFDIYMTERLYDASWQDWTPAINLGDTINTKGFEAYFSTYPSGESYFASDREGASLDLYRANISITYRDDQVKPVAPPADSDGDGVLDKDDQCPNVIGTVANRGCPEVTEEVQKQLNDYARTILFDTGKSIIKAESFPVMVDIIQILNEYPYANFTVEGHTDNVGSDLLNQRLSEKRANAVRDFLIDNGISPNRLVAIGYGESRPIDTNYTITGRALNRRVEINLIKKKSEHINPSSQGTYKELYQGSSAFDSDQPVDRYDEMKVFLTKGIMLVEPSEVTYEMKIKGYAIQILATRSGIPPRRAYMEKFSHEVVKMSRGYDGLDRYYIREYDTLRKAAREMQKLRDQGFEDVFVRAIAEYGRL